jgi:hypothetical protein
VMQVSFYFPVCLFVFSFLKKLNKTEPKNAKYKVLFNGFEVMAQVPVTHPTYFQYRKPAIPPIIAPIK